MFNKKTAAKSKQRIGVMLAITSLLTGCEKHPLLLTRLTDASASALNNPTQKKMRENTCYGVADAASSGDKYADIQINQEAIATDATAIQSRDQIYADCRKNPQTKGSGTYVCPAFKLAQEISDRLPNYRPVTILQIEANEGETFCPEILLQLTKTISDRQGQLLIIGSTNDGNTGFNSHLWKTLKTLPNTQFCDQDVRNCVKLAIHSVRPK